MAEPTKKRRQHKAMGAREAWQKRKHEFNAARPKERFVGESVATGGHWEGRQ